MLSAWKGRKSLNAWGIKKEKNEKGGEKVFCCCHSCVYWSSCESLSLSLCCLQFNGLEDHCCGVCCRKLHIYTHVPGYFWRITKRQKGKRDYTNIASTWALQSVCVYQSKACWKLYFVLKRVGNGGKILFAVVKTSTNTLEESLHN